MKETKMLSTSICDHSKKSHKCVSSAKGKKAPKHPRAKKAENVPQSGVSNGIHNTKQDTNIACDSEHHKFIESEVNVISVNDQLQNGVSELHNSQDYNDKEDTSSEVKITGIEVESSQADQLHEHVVPEDTTHVNPGLDYLEGRGERKQIVVNMNIQNLDGEVEDEVFTDSNTKTSMEGMSCRKSKHQREEKKESDLKPINECEHENDETNVTSNQSIDNQRKNSARNVAKGAEVDNKQETEHKQMNSKYHKLTRPKSERMRRPKSSIPGQKLPNKRRPYSAVTMGRSSSASGRTTHASIVPTLRFTKEELDYYLPRRSFFSCHDKALKDAGYDIGTTSRKTRLIEAWAKQNGTEGNRPESRVSVVQNFDSLDGNMQQTALEKLNERGGENVDDSNVENTKESISSITAQLEEQRLHRQSSNSSIRSQPLTRKHSRLSRRRDHDEEEVKVDYQTLLQYLRYISENPEEYIHHRQNILHKQDDRLGARDSLVKLGTIFRRGRHGPSADSFLVHAVHDINPRFCDPGQWSNTNKEKTLLNLTSTKKDSTTFMPKSESSHPHESGTGSDEPKTEFEKLKHKMEAWVKTVTTAQLVKAKELALKELGEEDAAQSRWWVSLKSCYYLR